MLKINDTEYFDSVMKFAESTEQADQLQSELDYLSSFGGDCEKIQCHLYRDFSPHSFTFSIEKLVNGEWKFMFNGGLIYHGTHDNGGDGGAPTYSVNMSPVSGWSVHT